MFNFQIFANNTDFAVDTRFWLLILLPVYILISFIKHLDSLAWLSFISNVFMIAGFVCIFIYVFQTLHNPLHLPAVAPVKKLPLFFASSIFTYESIGLVSYKYINTHNSWPYKSCRECKNFPFSEHLRYFSLRNLINYLLKGQNHTRQKITVMQVWFGDKCSAVEQIILVTQRIFPLY